MGTSVELRATIEDAVHLAMSENASPPCKIPARSTGSPYTTEAKPFRPEPGRHQQRGRAHQHDAGAPTMKRTRTEGTGWRAIAYWPTPRGGNRGLGKNPWRGLRCTDVMLDGPDRPSLPEADYRDRSGPPTPTHPA